MTIFQKPSFQALLKLLRNFVLLHGVKGLIEKCVSVFSSVDAPCNSTSFYTPFSFRKMQGEKVLRAPSAYRTQNL